MSIIERIKASVEGSTGMPFLYHAAGELNELITRCNSLPIAYSFLLDSGTIEDTNGRYHERVTLAVMFCDKTQFDFNAIENEQIIDRMKVKAYQWLQFLRQSNALQVVSINNTQRLYDDTTDILTGFAVNITLEDMVGVGDCELPDVVIDIEQNGEYNVLGADKVNVNVNAEVVLEDLEVTQNGEYLPPTTIDGFAKVVVNVQPVLETLEVTENGTYTPSAGVQGFSNVNVNVENEMIPIIEQTGDATIAPNVWNEWQSVDSLVITQGDLIDGVVNHFMIRFIATANTQITWSGFVLDWVGDAPTYKNGKTYEISIVDNNALYAEFD